MALQTREQHIRREKATSNICTAQALLANIAAMYAVYHGPEGLARDCVRIQRRAPAVDRALTGARLRQANSEYFDTLWIEGADAAVVRRRRKRGGINFRYDDAGIGIALDETVYDDEPEMSSQCSPRRRGRRAPALDRPTGRRVRCRAALQRTSAFLTHPVFNSHHSETEMMRYIRRLERKDVGLDTSMIPLGSCTMKLNAASEMIPVTWPEFSAPSIRSPRRSRLQGYAQIFRELETALCRITGFAAVSLQPNSGAQGEFAGLMTIRAYHRDRGDSRPQRRPDSIVGARHQSGQRGDGRHARSS